MEAKDGGLDATTMFGVALGVSFGLGGLSGTASGAGGVSGAEEVPYRLVPAIVSEASRCDDETRALFSEIRVRSYLVHWSLSCAAKPRQTGNGLRLSLQFIA